MHKFSFEAMGVSYTKPGPRLKAVRSPLPAPPLSTEPPYPTSIDNFTWAWFDVPTHDYNLAALKNLVDAFLNDPRYTYAKRLPRDVVVKCAATWFKTLRGHWHTENFGTHTAPNVVESRREYKNAYGRKYRVGLVFMVYEVSAEPLAIKSSSSFDGTRCPPSLAFDTTFLS